MNILKLFEYIGSDLKMLSGRTKSNNFIFLSPRFLPVFLIRLSRYFYLKLLGKPLAFILSWLNIVFFGIECTPKTNIGHGLLIPHSNGIVIGALSLGNNVTIFQGVTIGAKEFDSTFSIDQRPIIGNNVVIGAGAKILGGIKLGDSIVVGANAVVLQSFTKNILLVGIPAKPKLIRR